MIAQDLASPVGIEVINQYQNSRLSFALFCDEGIVGSDVFRLTHFKGSESISELFEYELTLHANTEYQYVDPGNIELLIGKVIGRSLTVGVLRPSDAMSAESLSQNYTNQRFLNAILDDSVAANFSYFNGMVTTFTREKTAVYKMTLRPLAWRLTLTNHYRIFSNMSIGQVIRSVMQSQNIACDTDMLFENSNNQACCRVQNWLQAGESDWEFVKRLMSKAHIFFYFKTSAIDHTIVFSNTPAYPVGADSPLRLSWTDVSELGLEQENTISDYSFSENLTTSGTSVQFTSEINAADLEDPRNQLITYSASKKGQSGLVFDQYFIFQYGCGDNEANDYAALTQSTIDAGKQVLTGVSNCSQLKGGHTFLVTTVPQNQWSDNATRWELNDSHWVVTAVEHQASIDGSYTNTFSAIGSHLLVTPFSLQETQQGSVLAQVVAPDGATTTGSAWPYYDPNEFDPVQGAFTDSAASQQSTNRWGVYVRFATDPPGAPLVWVKVSASMTTIPEVGVTVRVARSEDQSEIPEIQSIVASDGNISIKPQEWSANTTVGSNYSTTYGDSLSVQYGRSSAFNLPQAVGIVQEAYQTGDFKSSSFSQGASYSYSQSESGSSGLLSKSESYGSTYSIQKGVVSSSDSEFTTTYSSSLVTGDSTNINTVNGTSQNTNTQNIVINESQTGASVSTDLTGSQTTNSYVGVSTSVNAVGSSSQSSSTGSSVSTNMVGQSTSTSLTGISQDVSATGSTTSVNVVGSAIKTSLTGSDISDSLTGASISTSLIGASTSTNLIGVQNDVKVVGASTAVSVIGSSTSISVAGATTNINISGGSFNLENNEAGTSLVLNVSTGEMTLNTEGLEINLRELKIYL